MIDPEILLKKLPQFLDQERLDHTLRVATVARDLATHWGCSSEEAYLAGLGHDIAKHLNPKKLQGMGIPVSNSLLRMYDQYKSIWHAFAAPSVLRSVLGIRNRRVLSAVKWHTTGCAKMSPLDQVLFVSDYIEPGRPFENRLFIEKLASRSLDAVTFAVVTQSLLNLVRRNAKIHPYSLACYHDYLGRVTKKDADEISKQQAQ